MPERAQPDQNREMPAHQNRLLALREREKEEQMADIKGDEEDRMGQQIRSYVFQPYTMVKDRRL